MKEQLTGLRLGDQAILRFRRPRPTAAISPQDTTHPDYDCVKKQAQARGFEPIEQGTGGRHTLFDENALGITIIAPQAALHGAMIKRYEILSGEIVSVHRSEVACAGIAEAYRGMGLNFDLLAYGAITDLHSSLIYVDVRSVLMVTVTAALMQA